MPFNHGLKEIHHHQSPVDFQYIYYINTINKSRLEMKKTLRMNRTKNAERSTISTFHFKYARTTVTCNPMNRKIHHITLQPLHKWRENNIKTRSPHFTAMPFFIAVLFSMFAVCFSMIFLFVSCVMCVCDCIPLASTTINSTIGAKGVAIMASHQKILLDFL